MEAAGWGVRAAIALALAAGCAHRAAPPDAAPVAEPREVTAVRRYLAEVEPPERFGDERLPVRIRGFAVWDLDGDGTPEVVLWTDPYYRQSPTITLYSVAASGKVRRLAEGLVPGPLVPATLDRRDPHASGLGADIVDRKGEELRSAGTPPTRQETDAFGRAAVRAALQQRLHAVQYPAFVHTDGRSNTGSYVDLSQEQSPLAASTSCTGFDFVPVEDVALGTLGGDPKGRYVAATAGGRLDLYRIDRIQPDGTLLKRRWTAAKPPDFVRFAGRPGGTITYETRTGTLVPLPSPRP